ncbi:hypothetical protein [Vibrio phage BUCT006]|nr:hypothetical protein [Vibrio phage BUCT006]
MIMQREWTEDDEKKLSDAVCLVERLRSKKAMIERVQRKKWEERFPKYTPTKPSKLKSTFKPS